MADLARGLCLARADLVGGQGGQGVGEGGEAGGGLGLAVLLAALEVLALRRGLVGGLGDARDKGGVLDEALVALGLYEGVVDLGRGAVDLARGEGVGEALCCLCAEGLALCRGCWGLWWLLLLVLLKGLRICEEPRRALTMLRDWRGYGGGALVCSMSKVLKVMDWASSCE